MKSISNLVDNVIGLGGSLVGIAVNTVKLPIEIGENLYTAVHKKEKPQPAIGIVDTAIEGGDDLVDEVKKMLGSVQKKLINNKDQASKGE